MAIKESINFSGSVDPLLLSLDQESIGFSLFSNQMRCEKAGFIKGLVGGNKIKKRLSFIKGLSVDEYVEETIFPAQHAKRPSAKTIISNLDGRILDKQECGPFYCVEIDLPFGEESRRIGIIAQERSCSNGAWMPEHHKLACDAIRRFAELSLPIVFFIDTPGADAGEQANSQNQAHSISLMISESTNVDVPTVGIIIGLGYSGGAIPLAATNILLSVRDGVFNTIQPHGLQSIARKFDLSWQECAKSVGVSPVELLENGCIDGVIDYSPLDDSRENLKSAIVSSIEAIEAASVDFVKKKSELAEHYHFSLRRYLQPSNYQRLLENGSSMRVARHPTMLPNIFGLAYRYMRHLTIRGRIHSSSAQGYGQLSKLKLPQGDLNHRLKSEQDKVFQSWLKSPGKLIYNDKLTKLWKNFISKYEDRDSERNSIARLILGEPQGNYDKSIQALLFEISFSIYNRWKGAAKNNFNLLIEFLKEKNDSEEGGEDHWPELSKLTIIDVVTHDELRPVFIEQCQNILIFDSLYNNVVAQLASISKEAMEHKRLSRKAVSDLLESSLSNIMVSTNTQEINECDVREIFFRWLRYFISQSHSGDLLFKVEEWKSIDFPQMNDSLFVILTYYFERLLPEYFTCEDEESFKGIISPIRIGRHKDFWNRLTMGYRDLLISRLLKDEKTINKISPEKLISHFFSNFVESNRDITSSNPVNFPGLRQSIEQALNRNIRACGLVTGFADIHLPIINQRQVAIAVSNVDFQAGAFDMASAEKFCRLLIDAAVKKVPVVCFISSGGMQTKEGAAALFSMAVVNDRITRFIRNTELPVIVFGFGDCTGGAQASFVTHPLVQTYYWSGTNMPFAGQMVVSSYLPYTSTLSNYLSKIDGAMSGLVKHPFSLELDNRLAEIDENIPLPKLTVEEVLSKALSSLLPIETLELQELDIDPKLLMRPFKKVLVHARGCTAVKLIRKAHESNIRVVLIASDPDMKSLPAFMLKPTDKLVCLGGNSSDESYLNAYSVLKIAEYEGVDALHPGIGFLSETPKFANLCVNNGINFIGPSAHSMMTMGNKSNAIQTAQSCNVPVVPGSHGTLLNVEQAANMADEVGYPVLLKAVHGGGGKGIQIVENREDMFHYYNQISTEARSAFGNGDLYLEKFIRSMRHIEVQLLRDSHGNTKILGLRDCSVQRNNQKIIEESSSVLLPKALKDKVYEYTLSIADKVSYVGAGTVEFIFDLSNKAVYFMEMNTRLQVEHPVTEFTSGIDIVKQQFIIASGHSIEDIKPVEKGYSIEVRINAEKIAVDSEGAMQLIPSPGKISRCELNPRKGIDVITIAGEGIEISPYYDSLIAQVICYGKNRNDVINKLYSYLDECIVEGVSTNIALLKRVLSDRAFNEGEYDTNYLHAFMSTLDAQALISETESISRILCDGLSSSDIRVQGSEELKVVAASPGIIYSAQSPSDPEFVKQGDIIDVNQTLVLMEAMKMFSQISLSNFNIGDAELYPSDKKYRIEQVMNTNGQQVSSGDLLFVVRPVGEAVDY